MDIIPSSLLFPNLRLFWEPWPWGGRERAEPVPKSEQPEVLTGDSWAFQIIYSEKPEHGRGSGIKKKKKFVRFPFWKALGMHPASQGPMLSSWHLRLTLLLWCLLSSLWEKQLWFLLLLPSLGWGWREEECRPSHLPHSIRKGLKYCRKMAEFMCAPLLIFQRAFMGCLFLEPPNNPGTAGMPQEGSPNVKS